MAGLNSNWQWTIDNFRLTIFVLEFANFKNQMDLNKHQDE